MAKQFTIPCICQWMLGNSISQKKYLARTISLSYNGVKDDYFIKEIMKLEGDDDYTIIHFADGRKITVSYSLKDLSAILPSGHFGRYCKECIVNLGYVKNFIRTPKFELFMDNGKRVPFIKDVVVINRNKGCHQLFLNDFLNHGNK